MKATLQVLSFIMCILGALAILTGLIPESYGGSGYPTAIAGIFYFAQAFMTLKYIDKTSKKEQ